MTRHDKGDGWDDDDNLVVNGQPDTWSYFNPHGQIVIRQRAEVFEEDDPYVLFNVASIPALIRALAELYQLAVDYGTGRGDDRLGDKMLPEDVARVAADFGNAVDGETVTAVTGAGATESRAVTLGCARSVTADRGVTPAVTPAALRQRRRRARLRGNEEPTTLFGDAAE